jgi:hypothetical protein
MLDAGFLELLCELLAGESKLIRGHVCLYQIKRSSEVVSPLKHRIEANHQGGLASLLSASVTLSRSHGLLLVLERVSTDGLLEVP